MVLECCVAEEGNPKRTRTLMGTVCNSSAAPTLRESLSVLEFIPGKFEFIPFTRSFISPALYVALLVLPQIR